MSKRHICKSKFHVSYHFLKYLEKETLLTLPVPSILIQLIELKSGTNIYI